jgi:hypothetical protein
MVVQMLSIASCLGLVHERECLLFGLSTIEKCDFQYSEEMTVLLQGINKSKK